MNPAQRIYIACGVSPSMFNNAPDKGGRKGRTARRKANKVARASRKANRK